MQVKDLIKALAEFDPNLPVAIGAYGEEQNIETVTLTDDERQVTLEATQHRVRCKWVRIG